MQCDVNIARELIAPYGRRHTFTSWCATGVNYGDRESMCVVGMEFFQKLCQNKPEYVVSKQKKTERAQPLQTPPKIRFLHLKVQNFLRDDPDTHVAARWERHTRPSLAPMLWPILPIISTSVYRGVARIYAAGMQSENIFSFSSENGIF